VLTPIPVVVAIVAPMETPEAELVAVSTLVAEIELVAVRALVAVVTFVSVRVATPTAFEPPSPLTLVLPAVGALPLVPFPPELVGTTVLSIEQDANGASTATTLRNSRVRVIMQGKLQYTFHSNALKCSSASRSARNTRARLRALYHYKTEGRSGAAVGIALASAHYRPTSSQVSIVTAIAINTCEAACESSLRCRRGSTPRLSF
jgi:hypothetical protein